MKPNTIKEIVKQIKKLKKDLQRLTIAKEKLFEKQVLPSLRKKYIGKCYIYINSYSSDEEWPLYVKIIDVEDEITFVVNAFEKRPDRYEVAINQTTGKYILQTEISLQEYEEAFESMMSSIKQDIV